MPLVTGGVVRVDHISEGGVPMVRTVDGSLLPSDAEMIRLGIDEGTVLVLNDEGWSRGSADDWEPRLFTAVVDHVEEGLAVIAGPVTIRIPATVAVEAGDTIVYDNRQVVLRVMKSAPPKSLREQLMETFDASTLRQDPDPTYTWDRFAGFEGIVATARELVAVHLNEHKRRRLAALGARPARGILFAGPPGTGKTFLGKIIAAQAGAAFYSVSTASLGGQLVGESESRLEAIYRDAASQPLSIVFVDEIDAITKARAESSQASDSRLVNVFLTNMDGIDAPMNVITIGTTNQVNDIDHALRRPGRFDREVFFHFPDAADRLAILAAGQFVTEGGIPREEIAEATSGWSPAELDAIWQRAAELTARDSRDAIFADYFRIGFEQVRAERTARRQRTAA